MTTTETTDLDRRYRRFRYLGGGSFSDVYLVHDEVLDRDDVALELLKNQYAKDKQFVERFRREVQDAAALSHPDIVQVYDVGEGRFEGENVLYKAMEYVPGGTTLKDLIQKEAPLPAPEATRLTLQVAEALQKAHERGIIHRDVKPENILLTSKGDVKVADFGIAKAAASSTLTTDQPPYTPAYASPEQKRGESVDHRSDLYTLGVTLYEMLTGELPFDAEQAREELLPPKVANPEVPEELSGITTRLLAEDPEERYPDAMSLMEDLERVGSKPEPAGERRERAVLAESLAEIATSGSREQLLALEAALEDVRDEARSRSARAKEDVRVLRAQNALRMLVDRARIRKECYSTSKVEEMLGVSRERLGQLREDGELLGIAEDGSRSTLYPYWQFGEEGLLEGLEEIVAAARDADMDPETLHFFMTESNDRLGGRVPAELLREGEAGRVARVLRTSGLGGF